MHLSNEQLLELPIYGLNKAQKQAFLASQLSFLDNYHLQHCALYQRLQQGCEQVSPLTVPLFKEFC